MSTTDVRPSSIEGIKRLAKAISKRDEIQHSKALDKASQASGFANFQHARRSMTDGLPENEAEKYQIYISTYWRDGQTRASGRETIRVLTSKALDDLIKPAQYRHAHKLGRFRRYASDHVVADYRPDSAEAALARACAAARVLQFMDITGLRASGARVEPRGGYDNRLPGHDHGSSWYDPSAGHHVAADEPYAASVASKVEERDAWARRNNWSIARPQWKGMYYPDGGSELYLLADAAKGYSLDRIIRTLAEAAPPIVPDNCVRIVVDGKNGFVTPARKRTLRAGRSSWPSEKLPRRGVRTTPSSITLRLAEGGDVRIRECPWRLTLEWEAF